MWPLYGTIYWPYVGISGRNSAVDAPIFTRIKMRFNQTCLESFGYTLPDECVSTAALEDQLRPIYERLRLPEGRLELITGVRERRFWPVGTLPSQISIQSAEQAIAAADFDRSQLGCLIHASVCRDHLEPATACAVHHGLGLSPDCQIFDLSNACLGLLNGVVLIGTMIEAGMIRAGLVVGTESSRQLVETTVATLNADTSLTRKQIKAAIASLTIGSGSCAILVCDQELSKSGNRILGGAVRAHTQYHQLCQSGSDEAGAGMTPLMQTDAETLMNEGCRIGAANFETFLRQLDWSRDSIDRTICHQVGPTHSKAMFEALKLNHDRDFTTVEWLGNTGSVALPITMAVAAEQGHLGTNENVAMLGIGSGINCVMLGCDWQRSIVGTETPSTELQTAK